MANPTAHSTVIEHVSHEKDDILRIKGFQYLPITAAPPSNPHLLANIPESARNFFASVSSPVEILSSKLVSRIDIIEGGYNYVHILHLDIGEPDGPFSFILRFPINLNTISRWQTSTSVGCMLYCQWHPDLNIPTPAIYAYSCTQGSEFIVMEYIDGDDLSEVWMDLPEEEKYNMASQVAEIMRTMRTKTAFSMIGGISPDGSPCPLVDGVNVDSGRGVVDSLCLYNIGPYDSVQEYVRSIFDRSFHYMDQMLYKGTLSDHESEFRREMSDQLFNLTPEDAFERIKSKRDNFIAHPYNCEYPFVLRHGDLHGRNVIVSHSSPRRILAILDWDFGGSHALQFADKGFEVCWPDLDDDIDVRIKDAEEVDRFQTLIDRLAGALPVDVQLNQLMLSTRWHVLNQEAQKLSGKDTFASTCLDGSDLKSE